MYDFHLDQNQYFSMQKMICEEYIIPFIEKSYPLDQCFNVLEIGCGTAGVISCFLEKGHTGFGIDLDDNALNYAHKRLADKIESNQLTLINNNIFSIDFEEEYQVKFDIIMLKDVIEHLFEKEKLFRIMQSLLAPSGVILIGFPPWQMPFGGHQQICNSKFLSRLPYFHLFPMPVYKFILKIFGEYSNHLCELKKTGISIEQLEKLASKTGYKIVNRDLYLINPIYKYKFKMKARKQVALIRSIPYIRNFFTTCAFYLLQAKNCKL